MYSKGNIETHNDGGIGRPQYPAVNVKSYNWPHVGKITDAFGCSEAPADKASEYAWEMHSEGFWEMAPEDAKHHFGEDAKAYSAGRSGGWLIVTGLAPIETWDAIMVSKWGRFEREMRAEVDRLCSDERVMESIEANEWALDADAITAALQAV